MQEGGFLLSEVSDWYLKETYETLPVLYYVRMKNGSTHVLDQDEFRRFRKAWDGDGPG